MKKDLIQSIKVVFLALVLATGVSFVSAAWNEPTGAPPSNNAPEPINVSGTAQIKDGGVVLSALGGTGNQTIIGRAADAIGAYFRAVVYGNLGADKYCDRAGQNCKTILELGNPGGVDDKQVKTSSIDTTANYLINELVAGNGIVITETGTTDKKVTVSSSGVSKIIAGTGITVSPTGGTGDVTVSASGGGGGGAALGRVRVSKTCTLSGEQYDYLLCQAECPAPKVVMGGGCYEHWSYSFLGNYPKTEKSWECRIAARDDVPVTFTAHAICINP